MEYGIVRCGPIGYHKFSNNYSTCHFIAEMQNGKTKSLWNKALSNTGLQFVSDEPSAKELFEFVKSAFEEQKNVQLDIRFIRGYIASVDGTTPIRSDHASRLFSGRYELYIDELILASLFEYVSTYYLWARDFKDDNVFSFCFRYTLMLLNCTNRLGILTSDEQKCQLVKQLTERYDIQALNLISDLYWSCLAFAFCHEIAHVYLKHTERPPDNLWKDEYDADDVGYEVSLKIIEAVHEDPRVYLRSRLICAKWRK